MKFANVYLFFTVLSICWVESSIADSFHEHNHPEWVSCSSTSDCMIFDSKGCLGELPSFKKYEIEMREWARSQNVTMNCAYPPGYKPLPLDSFTADCENGKCVVKRKP